MPDYSKIDYMGENSYEDQSIDRDFRHFGDTIVIMRILTVINQKSFVMNCKYIVHHKLFTLKIDSPTISFIISILHSKFEYFISRRNIIVLVD